MMVLQQCRVYFLCKVGQTIAGKTGCIVGQEMIVDNIYKYSAVFTTAGLKDFLSFQCGGMCIGESIDASMQSNALLYIYIILQPVLSFHEVGNHIADNDRRLVI